MEILVRTYKLFFVYIICNTAAGKSTLATTMGGLRSVN